MAQALVVGVLAQNHCLPQEIMIAEPLAERRLFLATHYGVAVTASNQDVIAADVLLLAIKPQVLEQVVADLGQPIAAGMVVSILAGISLKTLEKFFPRSAVIRAMPNTPALIGMGSTALSATTAVTAEQYTQIEQLFQAVGQVIRVPESLLDAVTGLSGSGPAYVALIAEALMDGGVAAGLPRSIARDLVLATITGSIELMLQKNLHPAQLKDQVTSPGGTTIAGLAELEERAVRGALIAAVLAATERSRVLGKTTVD